jgi:hypothetical protein
VMMSLKERSEGYHSCCFRDLKRREVRASQHVILGVIPCGFNSSVHADGRQMKEELKGTASENLVDAIHILGTRIYIHEATPTSAGW